MLTHEEHTLNILRNADMYDLLRSQIWWHENRFKEKPALIEVCMSLYRPTLAAISERFGVDMQDLVLKAVSIDDVPIVFKERALVYSSSGDLLWIYGSKPAHRWSI